MSALFLAFSSFFFIFKQNVLSDIPFFLFVCSSLYAFECWKRNSSKAQGRLFFILFLFSMSAALWVRLAGSILFISAVLYFLFIERDIKALVAVLAVSLINAIILFLWMGWHPGFWIEVGQNHLAFLNGAFNNFGTVFQSLWYFFCPSQTVFSRCLFNLMEPVVSCVAPFIYSMSCKMYSSQ